MPRRTFTRKEIDEFRTNAKAAPSVEKMAGFSLREVIAELADIMTEMKTNRGYTMEDLVTWWRDQGVTVSAATLRAHLKSTHVDNGKLRPSSRRSSRGKATKSNSANEPKQQTSRRSTSTRSSETPPGFPGLKIPENL